MAQILGAQMRTLRTQLRRPWLYDNVMLWKSFTAITTLMTGLALQLKIVHTQDSWIQKLMEQVISVTNLSSKHNCSITLIQICVEMVLKQWYVVT